MLNLYGHKNLGSISISHSNKITFIAILLLLIGCSSEDQRYDGVEGIPDIVEFNRDVRSILSESCFSCHGPDAMAREAALRLDTEEGAYSVLGEDENRFAIIPGNPEGSELYKRISSDDPDYYMPTPTSNLPHLSTREIAILKKWIEQGAEYQQHWSFIPPERVEPPRVINSEWPENEIDYFVLQKLEEIEISPSPKASKEKLLRRVSFDLTGLPPTIEELDQFINDGSPDAYEKAVDRLLASEGYGERMATEWMDAARYADTHGYEDDSPNEMWPWREWLISAFNQTMPFDQFTTWQLAGDLLPDATPEQKLATGFNRLHQQTGEGGIIEEEYRVEYVADRVYTTGTTFLGITMQCARCHDHKYDPISEVDYYKFFAFFDNVNERGKILRQGAAGPVILLPDDETKELINYLEQQISEKERSLEVMKENKVDDFFNWRNNINPNSDFLFTDTNGLIAHLSLDDTQGDSIVTFENDTNSKGRISGSLKKVNGVQNKALEFSYGNFINLGSEIGAFERTDSFSFSFWINPADTTSEVPIITKIGGMNAGYKGYDVKLLNHFLSVRLVHGWPYNAVQVQSLEKLPLNKWTHIGITYDGSSKANGIQMFINGQKAEYVVKQNNLVKNIASKNNLLIAQRDAFGEQVRMNFEGVKLDEVKVFNHQLSAAQVLKLAGNVESSQLLAEQSDEKDDFRNNIFYNHYLLQHDMDIKEIQASLQSLRVEKSSIKDTLREVMVMQDRLIPRQTFVRKRGMYDDLREKVSPGAPKSILEFSDDLPKNRLGLAQWILSPENPLTSRVIVNRYWKLFFGEGLVDTSDDFGNQGSMPTHPELLDWLAVFFRENEWDLKKLHKLMVMSQTYKQDSKVTVEQFEEDPQNKWLSRGTQSRLTAEMVRDNALVASGLLVSKIGGKSVFPYQPEGLWEETTSGRYLAEYIQDEGESLYRRSLYTFIKRSSPPPGMMTFDAPERNHPVVSRQSTNTPLQALHILNDVIYLEASRVLAERMMTVGGDTLQDQITFAFRAATSRFPNEKELGVLRDLYDRQLSNFKEDPEKADELLKVGESNVNENLDPTKLAAGSVVVNTILNLHETITKQ